MIFPSRLLTVCLAFALTMVAETQAAETAAPAAGSVEALHQKECGSCHTPYQAYFLPAASWEKIMSDLSKHFGENAELAPEDQAAIKQYLMANAADRSSHKRASRVMSSLAGKEAPLRLTEVPYIISKHREVPKKAFQNNPKLKNLSNCGACHPRAAAGNYEEDEVKIPGMTNWEDD